MILNICACAPRKCESEPIKRCTRKPSRHCYASPQITMCWQHERSNAQPCCGGWQRATISRRAQIIRQPIKTKSSQTLNDTRHQPLANGRRFLAQQRPRRGLCRMAAGAREQRVVNYSPQGCYSRRPARHGRPRLALTSKPPLQRLSTARPKAYQWVQQSPFPSRPVHPKCCRMEVAVLAGASPRHSWSTPCQRKRRDLHCTDCGSWHLTRRSRKERSTLQYSLDICAGIVPRRRCID